LRRVSDLWEIQWVDTARPLGRLAKSAPFHGGATNVDLPNAAVARGTSRGSTTSHQSAVIVHAAGFLGFCNHGQGPVALASGTEQHFPESQQPRGGTGSSQRVMETPVRSSHKLRLRERVLPRQAPALVSICKEATISAPTRRCEPDGFCANAFFSISVTRSFP